MLASEPSSIHPGTSSVTYYREEDHGDALSIALVSFRRGPAWLVPTAIRLSMNQFRSPDRDFIDRDADGVCPHHGFHFYSKILRRKTEHLLLSQNLAVLRSCLEV